MVTEMLPHLMKFLPIKRERNSGLRALRLRKNSKSPEITFEIDILVSNNRWSRWKFNICNYIYVDASPLLIKPHGVK